MAFYRSMASGLSPIGNATQASDVNYDSTGSDLEADNLQDAILEINDKINDIDQAEQIHYDNTESGLESTFVQDAIDELEDGGGTPTFTSTDVVDGSATAWTSVAKLDSGETNKSILNKISTMFKNIRFLYKMLGTTDISAIGDGSVTNAISTLNGNLITTNNNLATTNTNVSNKADKSSLPIQGISNTYSSLTLNSEQSSSSSAEGSLISLKGKGGNTGNAINIDGYNNQLRFHSAFNGSSTKVYTFDTNGFTSGGDVTTSSGVSLDSVNTRMNQHSITSNGVNISNTSSYTCPSDGYLVLYGGAAVGTGITFNIGNMRFWAVTTVDNYGPAIPIFVRKGTVITLESNSGGSAWFCSLS